MMIKNNKDDFINNVVVYTGFLQGGEYACWFVYNNLCWTNQWHCDIHVICKWVLGFVCIIIYRHTQQIEISF